MNRAKPFPGNDVSDELRALVDQLAALQAGDLERIIQAVRSLRDRTSTSWSHVKAGCGIAQLGGDAVRDTRALYDD